MGYSPWGQKELDTTERLNDSNVQLLTGKTSSKERDGAQASSSYGTDRRDGPKKSQLVNLERKLAPQKFLCLSGLQTLFTPTVIFELYYGHILALLSTYVVEDITLLPTSVGVFSTNHLPKAWQGSGWQELAGAGGVAM